MPSPTKAQAEEALIRGLELAERNLEIQTDMVDHFEFVTFPNMREIVLEMYNLREPDVDYAGDLSRSLSYMGSVGGGASRAFAAMSSRYSSTCLVRDCGFDFDLSEESGATQVAHNLFRLHEKRRYDLADAYRELASVAHHGSRQNPSSTLSGISSATSIFSTIAGSFRTSKGGGIFSYIGGIVGGYYGGPAGSAAGSAIGSKLD